ncbi:protogenin-like isoform X1 [Mytilus edulis]|uniref:protogenin-like isoform X1 n=2 Tax=Mytilus TaxID=6548 RepID=UPI0039EF11AA
MFFSFAAGLFAVVYLFIFVQGNVELDPGITIHPAPSVVIAQKNSPLLLNCSASSSPDAGPVTITWFKDGQPVVIDRRVQVRENGSLYFTQVKKNRNSKNRNHNGFYECFIKNKYGTVIARQVHLQVARISKSFSIEPADQEVKLGGVARFKCQIDGIPPPLYVWEKNSSPLPHNNRYITLYSGILQIHNISESDAGSFHCSVYQSFNKVNNVPVTIDLIWQHSRVQAGLKVITDTERRPPKIVAISKEVNATIKHSVTLECLADGNPSPVVTWMKDGNPTLDDNFKEINGRSNLKFIKVGKIDAGTYKCVASSPGFPDAVAETKLNVKVPPFIIEAPVSEGYPVARRFRLKCTVGGTPTPKVTWYKNGQKIESLENMQINPDNELLIDSSTSDSGYYQCIAKNDVGVDMAIARLQIILKENAPKPPGNVTVTSVTSTEVCIQWSPSEYPDCCPVLAYTVHYGELKDVTQKAVTLKKNECIHDLKPHTDYKFYIRAYSRNGAGAQSDTVTVKTLESVPDAAPNLRLSSSSPYSIDVEWDPVPPEKCNGVITGYQIFVSNGGHEIMENVSAANQSYTFKELQADTEYKVRVLAGTAVGFPKLLDAQWPWLIHRTPKHNEKPQVKVQIQVSQLNLTCVDVKWNITDNQAVIGYKIYLSKKIQNIDAAQIFEIHDIKRTNYVMCGLESEKFYELMFVVDGSSNALATVEEIFQTVPPNETPLPPPPLQIIARIMSSSEIMVRWKRPGRQYDIKFYTVQFHRRDNSQKIMYARSDALEYELKNLEPYTYYSIRVRSHTTHDHGIFSDPVDVRTLEDVPSPPEKLYIERIDEDKVNLHWEPPTKQNGVITSYVIQYNHQKEDPENLWQSLEKNGTMTKATINGISKEVNYYFKVRACTNKGESHPSRTVELKAWICTFKCEQGGLITTKKDEDDGGILKDQRLGIIIGCSIGLSSIVICIVVVIVRQRHYARMYMTQQGVNGSLGDRNVGHYLSNHNGRSPYHMVDEDSRLPMIQENALSDTKGPDDTVRFPGNGRVIYLCNGKAPNGKIRAYVASPINGQVGERTALIASKSSQQVSDNSHQDSYITHSQSDGNVPMLPHKNSERGYKYEDRKSSGNSNDIDNATSKVLTSSENSQANGAPPGQIAGSHGNHDLEDSGDLISKMLQATTSVTDCSDVCSTLPQRSGSSVTMEISDLLAVDA